MSASLSNHVATPGAAAPQAASAAAEPITPDPDAAWVDTHFHVFAAAQAQPGARYVPGYAALMDQWQAAAQASGVRRGVLVQTSFMGTDNRLLLQELARQPQVLRGVAVLTADTPPSVLPGLHAAGVRGLRLNLAGTPHDLRPWHTTALWQPMLALGWHLELHTDAGALPQVLSALPAALPVVLDHMAKPLQAALSDATVQAVLHRHRQQPVHVKLSAAYRLQPGQDAAALARLWHAALGPQALLWGSDWPCTNHEAQAHYPTLLAQLQDWLDDAAALRCTLQDNPARLYGFVP